MRDTNVAPKAENSIIEYAENMTASFDEQGFNEVDGLILAQIANFDFSASGIDLYSGDSKTIEGIMKRQRHGGISQCPARWWRGA